MNWKSIFYPRRVLKALDIESSTIWAISRFGLPDNIIHCFGGIGDDLLCTTVVRELKKRKPSLKIWIISKYAQLFSHNPDFSQILQPDLYWKVWHSPLLKSRRLLLAYTAARETNSHLEWDISPTEHIISVMCKKVGIHGEIELRPYLYLTEEEKRAGRHFSRQIAIQCIGEESGSAMLNKLWQTDRFQSVIDKLSKMLPGDFHFIQLGSSKDPLINGVTDFRGKTTIRETAAILNQSACFVGTVGFLMHLARAVDCRSVIIYGGREHSWQSGYSCNENLNTFIECAPCWKWNECDLERRCMQMITVETVVEAIEKVLINSNELVDETITI